MTARPDEVVAWLRPTDAGTDNECLFVCAANDPDSFPVVRDSALKSANARLAELEDALTLMEHKVITCGVAASYPDATLTTRGDYLKWDSPQAQSVRTMRTDLESRLAAVLALADEWVSEVGTSDCPTHTMAVVHECAAELRRAALGENNGR